MKRMWAEPSYERCLTSGRAVSVLLGESKWMPRVDVFRKLDQNGGDTVVSDPMKGNSSFALFLILFSARA